MYIYMIKKNIKISIQLYTRKRIQSSGKESVAD